MKTSNYAQVVPNDYGDPRLNGLKLIPFYGSPILENVVPEFDFSNPPINPDQLVSALTDLMLNLRGVGISANQVGLPFRVFIFGDVVKSTAVFNPKIIGYSKEKIAIKEGCLSIPGLWIIISRPTSVVVSYQNSKGESIASQYDGISARVFQHEFDHMEGRNFLQLASPLKLKRAVTAFKKSNKKHKNWVDMRTNNGH